MNEIRETSTPKAFQVGGGEADVSGDILEWIERSGEFEEVSQGSWRGKKKDQQDLLLVEDILSTDIKGNKLVGVDPQGNPVNLPKQNRHELMGFEIYKDDKGKGTFGKVLTQQLHMPEHEEKYFGMKGMFAKMNQTEEETLVRDV